MLVLLVVACGEHAGSALSGGAGPTATPVPWIAAPASFPPVPTVTPEPIPTSTRLCRSAELTATHDGAQGAGGWWTGALRLTTRDDLCLIHGPVELRFFDTAGQEIVRSGQSAPGAFRNWAVLGEAQVSWLLSNWCEPRVAVASIAAVLPGDPTPVVADLTPPMGVGARCNSPEGPKGATTMWVRPWPTPIPMATATPPTLGARIDAPATALAGETLSYLVTLTNLTTGVLTLEPCPSYLEWLGGHALPTPPPPSNWPSFKIWSPVVRYGGVAKEAHLLNCEGAPSIPPAESVTFEMRLTVPADALGPDTLRWEVIGRNGGPSASVSITIVRQ